MSFMSTIYDSCNLNECSTLIQGYSFNTNMSVQNQIDLYCVNENVTFLGMYIARTACGKYFTCALISLHAVAPARKLELPPFY